MPYDELAKAKKRLYYQKNRKKRLEYQRAYNKANKDNITAKVREKKKQDPEYAERIRKYQAEYWRKNKAEITRKRREKRAELRKLKAMIDAQN